MTVPTQRSTTAVAGSAPETNGAGAAPARQISVRRRFWRGVWLALRRRPSRIAGVLILLLFLFMAVGGPWLYPERLPYDANNIYAPISWEHPLSTDFAGVDVLALVVTGTRGVLLVAAAAGLVTMVIGTGAGLFAGYRRGIADSVLMRVADFVLTVPGFPLLIVLTTTIDVGTWWKMALVLGLIGWGGLARAVRSQILSLRERGFIEAARGLGLPTRHIVVKELLPNIAPYVATNLLIAVTGYIYAQVGLYFLGVLPLDTSNWGVMLNAAVFNSGALIAPDALPYLLAPLGAILLLTLGVVLIVDALEEIFNPRLREG